MNMIELYDGVYILHETLGVRTVKKWNPEDNDGVIGILVVEDNHQLVVALEDSPENLIWSNEKVLVNQSFIEFSEDAESDFNGKEYCRKLNYPDFPAAYYCLNYKKGGGSWYLPSSGELWLICKHLEEIQTALSIVGGQKFVIKHGKDVPWYWTSTECSNSATWVLHLGFRHLTFWHNKFINRCKVRPVAKIKNFQIYYK